MSGARSAVTVPAALKFADEADGWGRLLSLTARGAEISTLSPLARGQAVALSFELGGERFKELTAVVEYVRTDDDGYCAGELRFTEELDRRRLARALLDVLSRR